MNLEAIRAHWLQICGNCDAGLGNACTCPSDDHRPVIQTLCAEVERLTAENRQLTAKNATAEQELAELDRENATLAGRASLAEEQLAAATLQEGGQ